MFLPIGDTPNPPGFTAWITRLLILINVAVHALDWAYVADNRNEWVKRWDREMAL